MPDGAVSPADRSKVASQLEAGDPGYLAEVRSAARRFANRSELAVRTVVALADAREHGSLDVDAPTASRSRAGRLVKETVKRLTGWYLEYLSRQLTRYADALRRLGESLAARTEELEARSDATEAELGSLAARVERLERLERLEHVEHLEHLEQEAAPQSPSS